MVSAKGRNFALAKRERPRAAEAAKKKLKNFLVVSKKARNFAEPFRKGGSPDGKPKRTLKELQWRFRVVQEQMLKSIQQA